MERANQCVKLLWSGGWDSTFRLLHLLLLHRRKVQPYYIKFPTKKSDAHNLPIRRSAEMEIETMDDIRNRLFEEYPPTKDLLLPTIIFDAENIMPDKFIKQSYKAILKRTYLGNQYFYLARFAKQSGLENLEIGVKKGGTVYKLVQEYLIKDDENFSHRINGNLISSNNTFSQKIYELFKDFSFPLITFSKLESKRLAEKNNFSKFLNMTCFCHRPLFGKFPCGTCNPCRYAIEDGFGWRIPLFFRIFGRMNKKIYNSKPIVKARSLYLEKIA